MNKTERFFTTDIFPEFKCKMGDCRHACCEGWPIAITMSNYFELLGVECTAKLRDKLDRALVREDRPNEEQFAVINPRYDGSCPLRAEDGSCALQNELGEGMIPDVCRLYPRGVRLCDGKKECSCACSCERTVEMLFENHKKLCFCEVEKDIKPPRLSEHVTGFETFGKTHEIRLKFISMMQNRDLPITQRLIMMMAAAKKADEALSEKSEEKVNAFLACENFDIFCGTKSDCEEKLYRGFNIIEHFLEYIDAHSESVSGWGVAALEYFKKDGRDVENYYAAKTGFESAFPDWEIKFEKLLCEHMFFSVFPFATAGVSVYDEFISLAAVYGLLRCLCLGNSLQIDSEEKLVDICSAVFRLVEHTEFEVFTARLLKHLGADDEESIFDFVIL